jgi:hypothetical protein
LIRDELSLKIAVPWKSNSWLQPDQSTSMPDVLSLEQLVALPPLIVGTIWWTSSIGAPTGGLCSGFDIRVEEHTVTQFRDAGGGNIEPIPGTGVWRIVADSVECREVSTERDSRRVRFQVTGLHLTAFPDGRYRITPHLQGNWHPSGLLSALSYRAIEPISASVILTKDAHIQTVDFEVVRRSAFSGRRLPS